MKIGRLALRTLVGGLFVGHGTQKLFGWFDGNGLEATAQGFEAMGLRPGRTNAILAGAGETAGGAALLAGYQTPLAAAPIVGAMIMAVRHVHGSNGPWSHKGGYEYNLVLTAAALAVVESGPGPLSLDALRGKEREGLLWSLVTLGLAAGGVAAVEKFAALKAPAVTADAAVAATAPAGGPVASDAREEDTRAAGGEDDASREEAAIVEEALVQEALIAEVLVEEAVETALADAAEQSSEPGGADERGSDAEEQSEDQK